MPTDINALPFEFRNAVNRELAAGEHALYVGQPDLLKAIGPALPILLFHIVWIGISLSVLASFGGLSSFGESLKQLHARPDA